MVSIINLLDGNDNLAALLTGVNEVERQFSELPENLRSECLNLSRTGGVAAHISRSTIGSIFLVNSVDGCLFLTLSLINHSCASNSSWTDNG